MFYTRPDVKGNKTFMSDILVYVEGASRVCRAVQRPLKGYDLKRGT